MSLADDLRARIGRDGPMTARDFLAEALRAYYGRGPRIGAEGDFYTASNSSLFAPPLARFARAALERLGGGARVVELGGGTGQLAAALGVPVTVVEPHEGMAEAQRAKEVRVVASLDDLDAAPTVFVANEVLDALPVHRLLMTSEGPREGFVDWRDGRFVEVPGPVSPPLAAPAARLAPLLAPGQAAEVPLDARGLFAAMARAAPRAVALFLDYGGQTDEVVGDANPHGTLRGYHQHRVADWLERPGEQDVTADVDFGQVAALAREAAFEPAGYAAQGQFLADLGLVDDLGAALARGDVNAYLAGKNLLMPGGMGARFKAFALVRGAAAAPPLPGFRGAWSGTA